MSEKLKPCSFCGGEAELTDYKDIDCLVQVPIYYAHCTISKCWACFAPNSAWHNTKNKAIKAWNNRHNERELLDEDKLYDLIRKLPDGIGFSRMPNLFGYRRKIAQAICAKFAQPKGKQ